MRIAFISDIHGNLTALTAVLADIQVHPADEIIFLGDAATIGAQPIETLDTLKELGCMCIMGNHDDAMLDPAHALEYQIALNLHSALQWGVEQLHSDHFDFLRTFRSTYEAPLSQSISMLCFHGSPRANTDVIAATTPAETLDGYFSGQASSIWVGGHTHIQMLRRHGTKLIINPGSVGNAFKFVYSPGNPPKLLPWAEYATVEVNGDTVNVDLRRVMFDTQEVLRQITESGNPSAPWWLEQYE